MTEALTWLSCARVSGTPPVLSPMKVYSSWLTFGPVDASCGRMAP
jgi:hypothetical protein